MGFLAGLTGLTSALGTGGAFEPEAVDPVRQSIANRTPIHVAPVGVNLGAILAPFNEGSPSNGGYGLDLPGRYQTIGTGTGALPTRGGVPWKVLIAIGGLSVGAFLILRR